jgi:hypothetical protein
MFVTLGQMKQGDFWWGVQSYRSESCTDTTTDIQVGSLYPVKPLRIGGHKMGQTNIPPWQAQFDLTPMIMTCQSQWNSMGNGLRKDLGAMREEKRGNDGIKST